MHTKTMEGLIGARTNMELLNTPFRVFKEARRKGDTAMMERAMGYMGDYSDRAGEYQAEADEGMKEDAEETRRIAKEQQEEAIKKRREEQEEQERQLEESREEKKAADTVEISEEGRVLLEENADPDSVISDGKETDVDGTDTSKKPAASGKADMEKELTDSGKAAMPKEPVTYTKTGEAVSSGQAAELKVSFCKSV